MAYDGNRRVVFYQLVTHKADGTAIVLRESKDWSALERLRIALGKGSMLLGPNADVKLVKVVTTADEFREYKGS